MINRLTYFCKKLNLSITLARHDLLCLIEGLSSFSDVINLARIFVKHSNLPLSERLNDLLTKIDLPSLCVSELSALAFARSGIFFSPKRKEQNHKAGRLVLQKATPFLQKSFFLNLLQEIYDLDFNEYKDGFSDLKSHMEEDMRLYASEREDVLKFSNGSSEKLPLQTDWQQTTHNEWVVDSLVDFSLTQNLTSESRQNLAELYAKQLFEKGFFVFGFNRIAVDSQNRVAFAEADSVFDVSGKYCVAILRDEPLPHDNISYRLKYSLEQLSQICTKDVVKKVFKNYTKNYHEKTVFLPQDKKISEFMSNYFVKENKTNETSFWSRHIEKMQSQSKTSLNKTSILYWVPALIVGMILFSLLHF